MTRVPRHSCSVVCVYELRYRDTIVARVLLVDDEMTILVVLQILMESAGHEAVTCNDGTKALSLLETSHFDLMISDVRMRPVDGLQLLKAACALQPPLPTILVSAYEYPSPGMTATALGAVAQLRKPFNNSQLLSCVEKALSHNKTSN